MTKTVTDSQCEPAQPDSGRPMDRPRPSWADEGPVGPIEPSPDGPSEWYWRTLLTQLIDRQWQWLTQTNDRTETDMWNPMTQWPSIEAQDETDWPRAQLINWTGIIDPAQPNDGYYWAIIIVIEGNWPQQWRRQMTKTKVTNDQWRKTLIDSRRTKRKTDNGNWNWLDDSEEIEDDDGRKKASQMKWPVKQPSNDQKTMTVVVNGPRQLISGRTMNWRKWTVLSIVISWAGQW